MRIGAFQIKEPLPEINKPHALAVLRPWVDVGDVGSMTLTLLEDYLHAEPLGELAKPGNFLDFTRYRPVVHLVEGQRQVDVPNSYISHASRSNGNDFLFFQLLEPHMQGDVYADSLLKVLQKLGVRRYCLIGGMYDTVPHTRPLIVSGSASGPLEGELRGLGVQRSNYEGPTTIVIQASQKAAQLDIEVMSLIVHLPQYVRVEKDYEGILCLMELICSLYNLPLDLKELRDKARKQNEETNLAVENEPHLKQAVQQMEKYYEDRVGEAEQEQPELSPEIEEFLRDATGRFEQN